MRYECVDIMFICNVPKILETIYGIVLSDDEFTEKNLERWRLFHSVACFVTAFLEWLF